MAFYSFAIYPPLKMKGIKEVGEVNNFQVHEGFSFLPGDALRRHAIALQRDICENEVRKSLP